MNPVYQFRYFGDGKWSDVTKEEFDRLSGSVTADDMRFRVLYTAPDMWVASNPIKAHEIGFDGPLFDAGRKLYKALNAREGDDEFRDWYDGDNIGHLLTDILNTAQATRAVADTAADAHPIAPLPADMIEARAQGRAEALAMLLQVDPDTFCSEYIVDGGSLPSGDRSEDWDSDKLRGLFRANDTVWSLLQAAQGEYWHNLSLREEAERNYARSKEADPLQRAGVGKPVAWVRKHPNGELSGDWLWNGVIEQVRKESGVWFPLGYLAAPSQQAAADEVAAVEVPTDREQILSEICKRTGFRVSKHALVDEISIFRMRTDDAVMLFSLASTVPRTSNAPIGEAAPVWYVKQIHEGSMPEFNKTDDWSDGPGGGIPLYSGGAAGVVASVHVPLVKGGLEVGEPVIEFARDFESQMDANPGKRFSLFATQPQAAPSELSEHAKIRTVALQLMAQAGFTRSNVAGDIMDSINPRAKNWVECAREIVQAIAAASPNGSGA